MLWALGMALVVVRELKFTKCSIGHCHCPQGSVAGGVGCPPKCILFFFYGNKIIGRTDVAAKPGSVFSSPILESGVALGLSSLQCSVSRSGIGHTTGSTSCMRPSSLPSPGLGWQTPEPPWKAGVADARSKIGLSPWMTTWRRAAHWPGIPALGC